MTHSRIRKRRKKVSGKLLGDGDKPRTDTLPARMAKLAAKKRKRRSVI